MQPFPGDPSDLVLAGPLLRRVQHRRIAIWLATSQAVRVELQLHDGRLLAPRAQLRRLHAGDRLNLLRLELELDEDLPVGHWTGYRVWLSPKDDPAALFRRWCSPATRSIATTWPGRCCVPSTG